MLRRDRHAPRWGQRRGAQPPVPAPVVAEIAPIKKAAPEPEATTPRAIPVLIEAGPPPVLEPSDAPAATESSIERPASVQAELPWSVEAPTPSSDQDLVPEVAAAGEEPVSTVQESREESIAVAEREPVPADAAAEPEEQPPVPANDVVAAPAIQPIVIGSESPPPLERKRGWWRRRS